MEIPDLPDDEENLDNSLELVEFGGTPLRQLLRKVKQIVRFFRMSEVATKASLNLQMEKNQTCLKLIQEMRTRWNSCYEMIERFLLLLADFVGRVLLQMYIDRSSIRK